MAETKDEIAAERDALKAENEQLRAQLANVTFTGTAQPEHRFVLSEGDRAELAIRGEVNIGGKMLTRDEVRELLGEDQAAVDLGGE